MSANTFSLISIFRIHVKRHMIFYTYFTFVLYFMHLFSVIINSDDNKKTFK